MEQRVGPDAKPAYERPAVTGSEIRVQETTNKIAVPDDKHDSRVIEVQATGIVSLLKVQFHLLQ